MRFSRLAAIAGTGLLVLGIASCSSTGGKPRESEGGGGGGTVDTPRVTIAMVTHEVPGDSFWDLIRKGAEAAAKKDNIELRYSNDPEAPNQANLVQTAVDSGVAGIAVTLASRFDNAKKAAIAVMSQMSSSEKPWPAISAISASEISLAARLTFMAKSSIARCRGVMSALR